MTLEFQVLFTSGIERKYFVDASACANFEEAKGVVDSILTFYEQFVNGEHDNCVFTFNNWRIDAAHVAAISGQARR